MNSSIFLEMSSNLTYFSINDLRELTIPFVSLNKAFKRSSNFSVFSIVTKFSNILSKLSLTSGWLYTKEF